MLAADKLLLQSTVKQRAIQLREKELSLFNDNFNAVGTQSAVLAGFAMTSFAEIDLPHNAFYAQKVRPSISLTPFSPVGITTRLLNMRSHHVSPPPVCLCACVLSSGVPPSLCDHFHLRQPAVHGVDDIRFRVGQR